MGGRHHAVRIGPLDQHVDQPRLHLDEGDEFQHPQHVVEPHAQRLEDEAPEAGRAFHQPLEDAARHQQAGDISLRHGFAGIGLASQQAERGLHAGLARRHRIEQDLAPATPDEIDADTAFRDEQEARRLLARAEQHGAPGELRRLQAPQFLQRFRLEVGRYAGREQILQCRLRCRGRGGVPHCARRPGKRKMPRCHGPRGSRPSGAPACCTAAKPRLLSGAVIRGALTCP